MVFYVVALVRQSMKHMRFTRCVCVCVRFMCEMCAAIKSAHHSVTTYTRPKLHPSISVRGNVVRRTCVKVRRRRRNRFYGRNNFTFSHFQGMSTVCGVCTRRRGAYFRITNYLGPSVRPSLHSQYVRCVYNVSPLACVDAMHLLRSAVLSGLLRAAAVAASAIDVFRDIAEDASRTCAPRLLGGCMCLRIAFISASARDRAAPDRNRARVMRACAAP